MPSLKPLIEWAMKEQLRHNREEFKAQCKDCLSCKDNHCSDFDIDWNKHQVRAWRYCMHYTQRYPTIW